MENIEYRQYEWESDDHKKALILRAGVMALPFGVTDWSRDLVFGDHSDEKEQFLLGAFVGDCVVGSVNLEIMPEKRLMLRQLAVHPSARGQGVARGLMELAEKTARENGFREIELHARPNVIAMYEKFGYVSTGEQEVCPQIILTQMIRTLD